MSFDVEIEALESDANAWEQAALEDLAGPLAGVAGLTLDGGADVMWVGREKGIDTTYEKARSNLEQLIWQAREYFLVIRDSLVAVAREYEQLDQAGRHRFWRHEDQLGDNR